MPSQLSWQPQVDNDSVVCIHSFSHSIYPSAYSKNTYCESTNCGALGKVLTTVLRTKPLPSSVYTPEEWERKRCNKKIKDWCSIKKPRGEFSG
jgi:hypothetical protein